MTSSLHSGIVRRRRQSGAALIIVLALLVLLTALMAIFLSRALIERKVAASSTSGNSASILARSAVDMITGDLRQEIVNGSTATTVGPSTNQTTLYFPVSVTNMVPQRVGIATNSAGVDQAPNLIRRSLRSDTLAVPSRASAVNSSTDASFNGRSIALSRWNSHYLIPRLSAGSSTIDSTPVAAFTAPDWVMVTSTGPKVLTTPDPTTTGRYAYAIYDEGGLLDANVAGYPSGMTNYLPAQLSGKGSLALADLTAIGLTSTDIDNLVGWRNYATAQPASGSFGSYNLGSDANASTNYYSYVSSNTNGYLVVNPRQYNSRTDQAFSSRQALLKYQRASGFSQDALQYLGTYSRDLEQPSFYPDPNLPAFAADPLAARTKNTMYPITTANGSDTYDTTGATQDQVNPSVLTVRDAAGQPMMKRRFPLSRISILETAADTVRAGGTLSTTQVNQVYDYFGLTWDSVNARWIYNHGDSTRILQLGQISTTAGTANPDGTTREPDFFETLKSAINCDSLAKQEGVLDAAGTPHGPSGSYADGQLHLQLVQIGANIIGQYTADSYPIDINFNGLDFYGRENLPYLAGWESVWYRMRALVNGVDINTAAGGTPPASGTTYESSVMIQPIVWNPNAPDANPNPPGLPTQFRVIASGTSDSTVQVTPETGNEWWTGDASAQHVGTKVPALQSYHDANSMLITPWRSTTALYTFPAITIDPSICILDFSAGAPAGFADFREPYRIRGLNDPVNSNAANDAGYPAGLLTHGDTALVTAGEPTSVIGFYCGKFWTGPSVDQNNDQNYLSVGVVNHDMKLKLQYKSPSTSGPGWLTYDSIDDVYNASGNCSTVDNTDISPYFRAFRTCMLADPRTNRWGLFHMGTFPSKSATDVPTGLGLINSNNNGVDGATTGTPFGNNAMTHFLLPQNITIMPNSASTYQFVGGALGYAVAPSWFNGASYFVPSDTMVNLVRTPNANPNSGTKSTGTNPNPPGGKMYYADNDNVIRRSSGWNFSGNLGLPLYTASGTYTSRPMILNRPFRSVAELGYVFRDEAWKDLDFFVPESGDAQLLDAFCLNEVQNAPADTTVAGRVNLNTRQPKVLQALIQGVSKAEGGIITPGATGEAGIAAQNLVTWTLDPWSSSPSTITSTTGAKIYNKGPLRNRSELVGKFVYQTAFSPTIKSGTVTILDGTKTYSGYSSLLSAQTGTVVFATAPNSSIKRQCESVMRALVDSGNTRTWNLLIDVVAQTGRYAPSAKTAADMPKFIVTGESRYWVHVAIDRYTGTIIGESFEPVADQ
jgi:Tfp pilus assembly protein PilX